MIVKFSFSQVILPLYASVILLIFRTTALAVSRTGSLSVINEKPQSSPLSKAHLELHRRASQVDDNDAYNYVESVSQPATSPASINVTAVTSKMSSTSTITSKTDISTSNTPSATSSLRSKTITSTLTATVSIPDEWSTPPSKPTTSTTSYSSSHTTSPASPYPTGNSTCAGECVTISMSDAIPPTGTGAPDPLGTAYTGIVHSKDEEGLIDIRSFLEVAMDKLEAFLEYLNPQMPTPAVEPVSKKTVTVRATTLPAGNKNGTVISAKTRSATTYTTQYNLPSIVSAVHQSPHTSTVPASTISGEVLPEETIDGSIRPATTLPPNTRSEYLVTVTPVPVPTGNSPSS